MIKKKNLLTLNVDGKSNLKIIKNKSNSISNTKDPLYLGGVPKDTKLKSLDTFGLLFYYLYIFFKKSFRTLYWMHSNFKCW